MTRKRALVLIGVAWGAAACADDRGEPSAGAAPNNDAATDAPGLSVDVGVPVMSAFDARDSQLDEASCDQPPAASDLVFTESGAVRGRMLGPVAAFLGLPYAAPPVGARRFVPPAPPACWSGVRDATTFGAVCPQRPVEQGRPGAPNAPVEGDEDCLTLNVWTSSDPDVRARPRAVMVFIHGGGNVQGSGSEATYDGRAPVERGGVVLVTLNYRLGPLGFLAHPALSAERNERVSGNLGTLDQIAALAWLKRNIAAFGGDPERVMVFGESAGGVNTCTLVASPRAAGLFHRALVQSGGCVGQRTLAQAEEQGLAVAKVAGCAEDDVARCLRAKTVAQLIDAGPPNTSGQITRGPGAFGPVVDGFVLPGQPLAIIRSGQHNRVPLVFGANRDETNLMVGVGPQSAAEYADRVIDLFGAELGAKVLAQYPVTRFSSPREAFVAVTSDYRFICPTAAYVQAGVEGGSPTWRYFFTKARDGSPQVERLGAFHGLELGFLFDTLRMPTPSEAAVGDAMLGYWTRFATSGDPNGNGAVVWPEARRNADIYLELGTPVAQGAGLRSRDCAFWAAALD